MLSNFASGLRSFFTAPDGTGLLDGLGDGMGALMGEREQADPSRFATWLPYLSYLPDEQLFINRDTLGFVLELAPQSGADETMVEVLRSAYAACPPRTGLQVHLFASPHVLPILRTYANLRVEDADQAEQALERGRPARNANAFRALARRRVAFLLDGAQRTLTRGYHYSVRNFRLLLSVCVPGSIDNLNRLDELLALRESLSATLRAACFGNRVVDADELINWCANFCNADRLSAREPVRLTYDDGREIRDQIVDSDTEQIATANGLRLGRVGRDESYETRFYSIKSFPTQYGLWAMGGLIGDLMQPAQQYACPFLLTMGVHVLDPTSSRTWVQANHWRASQNASSPMARVMPDVAKKLEDWHSVASTLDAGGAIVSLYHQLALFTQPKTAIRCEEAAKAIWRARGFELNNDVYMHRQALLASLPMTLSPAFHADLKRLRRVTTKTSANAIHLAPLLGEWPGTGTPTLILTGRRGQLMGLDTYDNREGNYTAAVVGAPGSGKSVLLNELAWSYLAVGAKVWMIDLGRSFEKLCRKAGGHYIEFNPRVDICLNPFSLAKADTKNPAMIDVDDMSMLHPVICKMASMSRPLDEFQSKAIHVGILECWQKYGPESTITPLRERFKTGTVGELPPDQRVRDLALMLQPFSNEGVYGRYFEGRASIDFSSQFIVIENEELKRRPDLHAVVNMLLMYNITAEMYYTRNRQKVLIIDELKQQLGDDGGDDPVKAAIVAEAARRARKYGGALITASQDADDYYSSAQMETAFRCSDWLFILRNKKESIEQLDRHGKIVMDETKKRLLNSLRMEPGVFSELYVYSPVGEGIARLALDPYTQLLFSNKLDDNAPLDERRARGMSIDEAIEDLLRARGLAH